MHEEDPHRSREEHEEEGAAKRNHHRPNTTAAPHSPASPREEDEGANFFSLGRRLGGWGGSAFIFLLLFLSHLLGNELNSSSPSQVCFCP